MRWRDLDRDLKKFTYWLWGLSAAGFTATALSFLLEAKDAVRLFLMFTWCVVVFGGALFTLKAAQAKRERNRKG